MKKRLRVLLVTEHYPPGLSGVSVVVRYLAEGLAKLDCEVAVLTRAAAGCPAHETQNGVAVFRRELFYTTLKTCRGDKAGFLAVIREFHADVLVLECSQCPTTDLVLPYLKALPGKKILHAHGFSGLGLKLLRVMPTLRETAGNSWNRLRWGWYYLFYFRRHLNAFDRVICLRKDESAAYLGRHFGEVWILPNAAEDIFFTGQKKQNSIAKYAPVTGRYWISVANYSADKNQIDILKAYYNTGITDAAMVFLGGEKNRYQEALVACNQRLAKQHGARSVHFLTGVAREDIPDILRGAELYLAASRREAFSLSLLEAMACGVPFVSTEVGNAAELPGGITVKSARALPAAIRALQADKNRMALLSEAGRAYAQAHSRTGDAVERFYHMVTNWNH